MDAFVKGISYLAQLLRRKRAPGIRKSHLKPAPARAPLPLGPRRSEVRGRLLRCSVPRGD